MSHVKQNRLSGYLAGIGLTLVTSMQPASVHATLIKWGELTFSPDGAVEVDQQGAQKVTRIGRTIGVITEAAAVNPSIGIAQPSDLAAIIGNLLTGDTTSALGGIGDLLDSIVANDPIAVVGPTFQAPVSSSRNNIDDVDFIVQGAFLTQRKEGLVFTDISRASITGQITFGGKLANVEFTPGLFEGITEQVTATMFSGTAHIDIDPTDSALFSFTSTLNADEFGGPFDSFSAAILTRWEATVSVIPEPSIAALLAVGIFGLGLSRRVSID